MLSQSDLVNSMIFVSSARVDARYAVMTTEATARNPAGAVSRAHALSSSSPRTDLAAISVTRDLLDSVFDTSTDATAIVDDVGCVRYVTPGTTNLLRTSWTYRETGGWFCLIRWRSCHC